MLVMTDCSLILYDDDGTKISTVYVFKMSSVILRLHMILLGLITQVEKASDDLNSHLWRKLELIEM